MKKCTWVFAIIITIATVLPATGQVKWSIGPELTSTGVGIGFTAKVTPQFGFSAEATTVGSLANQLLETYGDDALDFDGDITTDISVSGLILVGSFYPFGRTFSIDAGMFWGGYNFVIAVTPSEGVEFGGTTYTPEELGLVELEANIGGPSPILMFGWHGRGLNLSVGAYVNNLTYELSVDGLIANDPTFEQDLQAEIDTQSEDFSSFPVVPFFRLGFQFGPK